MMGSLAATIETANTALMVEGDVGAVPGFFTPDYVVHLTDGDLNWGHDGVVQFLGLLRGAFAGLQVEVEILVEGDGRVAWQRTVRGSHEGAFMGFPASGRPIVWRDMATSRFDQGRIAEEWVISDLAEQLLRARKGGTP